MPILQAVVSRSKQSWNFLKRVFQKVRTWLQRFVPGRRARKGAVIASVSAVLLIVAYASTLLIRSGKGSVYDVVVGVLIGAVLIGATMGLLVLVLALLSKLPRVFTGFLLGAVTALLLLIQVSPESSVVLAGAIVLMTALLGGSIAVITAPGSSSDRLTKKISVGTLLVLSLAALVWSFVWLTDEGTENGLVKVDESAFRPVKPLDASDPSQSGTFKVKYLTYGSGEDRRPEFGKEVQLITRTVDGKAFVNKLDGWLKSFRNKYWGFDRRKLPLNGRVWYPDGDGPFPLVLIVHGNHLMRDYSDPGYAYLGELLASRGYIFVSVDENFLNGDWSDNYEKENDARGWMMLEHLRVWREWNGEEKNPFYHKVDLKNISLIGHSRGGEAVYVAAAFNRLKHYPDDARTTFKYGFNIRSIVSIAPIDGQYTPADQSTPLENINYLLLQGSHDADLFFFSGDRQYKRLKFTGDGYFFKTSIYIYRANHGQFNTVWGNRDFMLPHGYLLNVKPFIGGEEQRRVAKVYISAFLDATLKGRDVYRSLFRNYRVAVLWLPKTYYVNRFQDSRMQVVSDYDEDIDLTTTTVKGGSQTGENLATWKEKDMGLRGVDTKRQNQVVVLGWNYEKKDSSNGNKDTLYSEDRGVMIDTTGGVRLASYTVRLPRDLAARWKINASSRLSFSVAESDEKPAKPDSLDKTDDEEKKDSSTVADEKGKQKEEEEKEEEKEKETDKLRKPLDFTIEVHDLSGRSASLPLSEVATLLPPLKAKFTRFSLWEKHYKTPTELVLQTVEIPLDRFVEVNRSFDPRRIAAITFRFERAKKGVIVLDEVGFSGK